MKRVPPAALKDRAPASGTIEFRPAILQAREQQAKRYGQAANALNGCIDFRRLLSLSPVQDEAESLLEQAMDKFCLSARAYTKTLRVARTLADLAAQEMICASHVAEALQYRFMEKRLVF